MPGFTIVSGVETLDELDELDELGVPGVLDGCVFSAQMYASSRGGTSVVEQAADSSTTNPMNSVFFKSF